MSYLVTGGTGFIGAYITRLLIQAGENVVAYDVNPQRDLLEQLMSKDESDRVKVAQGDITDLAHLIRTAQEYDTETIIHMASLLSIACSANPPLAVRVNCGGTTNVLETARILGLKKVVWASSVAVFGPPQRYEQEYIPNDAPHYPLGVYGAGKSFNEELAKHYFNEYGVDSIAIRFGMVYGVGQKAGASAMLAEELMVKPALGKPGRVPYGDDIINWLYVEDAATAVVMASNKATTKARALNIDGDIRPVAEAVEYIRKLVPDAELTMLPGYTLFPAKYDTTLIRKEIGYHPQWTIELGMKKVIDEIRKQHNAR